MSRGAYREFLRLSDKKEAGKSLSIAEETRLSDLSLSDGSCRKHSEFMHRLEALDVEVSSTTDDDLIARALVTVAHEEKVVPLRRQSDDPNASPERSATQGAPGRIPRKVGYALVGVLAVAALALVTLRVGRLSEGLAGAQRKTDAAPPLAETVELTFTSGEVLVNGKPRVVGPDALAPHSEIEVRDGRVCLSVGRTTDVCLAPHSRLRLDALKAGRREVTLLLGTAVAALLPRPVDSAFSVVSQGTRATAIGTIYAVERRDALDTQVTVLEGTVEVSSASQTRRVTGEHQVLVSRGRMGELTPTTRSELARHQATVAPRDLWQTKRVGVLHLASDPAGARTFLSGISVGTTPLSILLEAGVHAVSVQSAGYEPIQVEQRLAPGEVQRVALSLKGASLPAQGTAALGAQPDELPSILTWLSRARQAMKAGRWQEAAQVYESLRRSYPRSAESHTVLVTLGHLQLDRLNQPTQALRSFRSYLTSGGPLSQEAHFGKIRALRRLGHTNDERTAIVEYQLKFSGSADAASLRARLAELSKQ